MTLPVFSLDDDLSAQTTYRVSALKPAVRTKDRVNVFINDRFFCSLTVSQVVDQKIKLGARLDDAALTALKSASDFGKLYARALEYVFMRPRSVKEVRDYLERKTRDRRVRIKDRKSGEYRTVLKKGYAPALVQPVLERLISRGYLDDRNFAKTWVENRQQSKGMSLKKLRLELVKKGITSQLIEETLAEASRNDQEELKKVIARKRHKYSDEKKLVQYLLRQGFNYSDITDSLSDAPSFGA